MNYNKFHICRTPSVPSTLVAYRLPLHPLLPPGSAHLPVDILAGAVLKLLLDPLLQEVDAQLQAEVLLFQVIEVLRNGAIAVRHHHFPSVWGSQTPHPCTILHLSLLYITKLVLRTELNNTKKTEKAKNMQIPRLYKSMSSTTG